MEQATENARLREFLESKGLVKEFDAFVAAYAERALAAGTPELSISYQKMFSRSHREDEVNVTPWLRKASLEDACRFARLVADETDCTTDDDDADGDGSFLAEIVRECLDEAELEWYYRAHGIRTMLYGVDEHMLEVLPDVRPADHETVAALLIPAKGPVGPSSGSTAETVGPLI